MKTPAAWHLAPRAHNRRPPPAHRREGGESASARRPASRVGARRVRARLHRAAARPRGGCARRLAARAGAAEPHSRRRRTGRSRRSRAVHAPLSASTRRGAHCAAHTHTLAVAQRASVSHCAARAALCGRGYRDLGAGGGGRRDGPRGHGDWNRGGIEVESRWNRGGIEVGSRWSRGYDRLRGCVHPYSYTTPLPATHTFSLSISPLPDFSLLSPTSLSP